MGRRATGAAHEPPLRFRIPAHRMHSPFRDVRGIDENSEENESIMSNESVWQAFFDAHAPYYMQNEFTRNTAEEVQFVIEELRLIPPARILDVGCGTGRHSTALAQRGFRVTGV